MDLRCDGFDGCAGIHVPVYSEPPRIQSQRGSAVQNLFRTEAVGRDEHRSLEKSLLSSIIASHFRLDPSLPELALRGRVATAPRALDYGKDFTTGVGFLNTTASVRTYSGLLFSESIHRLNRGCAARRNPTGKEAYAGHDERRGGVDLCVSGA